MTDNITMPQDPSHGYSNMEEKLMQSLELLAQYGFTDNYSFGREIKRRETFSVTMPKNNVIVNTEFSLHNLLGKHVLFVQKCLGLSPIYWTLQDAQWMLRKLPKPLMSKEIPPSYPSVSDADYRIEDFNGISRNRATGLWESGGTRDPDNAIPVPHV